ncbi:MAG: OmpA family protein [Desulfobacteraceae bacterium]|nr:OmpA family protein [Desulfobacteraceae bacterium]
MSKVFKVFIVTILKLVFVLNCFSQNLIQNPEFDEYEVYYDNNRNIVYHPQNWLYNIDSKSHPLYFSTDRFLNQEIRDKFHPDGKLIYQGDTINYIGLPILPNSGIFYSKLSVSLFESENYNLLIDIRPLGSCNCLTDLIVYFYESISDSIEIAELVLEIPESLSFKNVFNNWITLETEYIASGKEKYLIIGTKDSNKYIKCINSNSSKYDCRRRYDNGLANYRINYGIDNVSLYKIDKLKSIMDSLKINDSFILENIYFKFEKAKLNENSYPILLKLFEYLESSKTVKIEIQGHTDNVGSKEFNDTLSFNRAKTVGNYLVENGISENRICFAGYGYEKPISSNDNEAGRQLNRRVEIKLLEK